MVVEIELSVRALLAGVTGRDLDCWGGGVVFFEEDAVGMNFTDFFICMKHVERASKAASKPRLTAIVRSATNRVGSDM